MYRRRQCRLPCDCPAICVSHLVRFVVVIDMRGTIDRDRPDIELDDAIWAARQRHVFDHIVGSRITLGNSSMSLQLSPLATHHVEGTCPCPLLVLTRGNGKLPLEWRVLASVDRYVDAESRALLRALNTFRVRYVCSLVLRVIHGPSESLFENVFKAAIAVPHKLTLVAANVRVEGSRTMRSDIDVTVWGERRCLGDISRRIAALHAIAFPSTVMDTLFDANVYVANFELGMDDVRAIRNSRCSSRFSRMIDVLRFREGDKRSKTTTVYMIRNVPDADSNAFAVKRLMPYLPQAFRRIAEARMTSGITSDDDAPSSLNAAISRFSRGGVCESVKRYRDAVSRIAVASVDRMFTCSAYKHVVLEVMGEARDRHLTGAKHSTVMTLVCTPDEYVESAYECLGQMGEYSLTAGRCRSLMSIQAKCVKFIHRLSDALVRRNVLLATDTEESRAMARLCASAFHLEGRRRSGRDVYHDAYDKDWQLLFNVPNQPPPAGLSRPAYFRSLVRRYLCLLPPLRYLMHDVVGRRP